MAPASVVTTPRSAVAASSSEQRAHSRSRKTQCHRRRRWRSGAVSVGVVRFAIAFALLATGAATTEQQPQQPLAVPASAYAALGLTPPEGEARDPLQRLEAGEAVELLVAFKSQPSIEEEQQQQQQQQQGQSPFQALGGTAADVSQQQQQQQQQQEEEAGRPRAHAMLKQSVLAAAEQRASGAPSADTAAMSSSSSFSSPLGQEQQQQSAAIQVTRDFPHLPVAQVRLTSAAQYAALSADPGVASVGAPRALRVDAFPADSLAGAEGGAEGGDPGAPLLRRRRRRGRKLLLAQSLPLIGQPEAAAAGFEGQGCTVVVADSGVNWLDPAFGACYMPGKPEGNCRVVVSQDIAPEDGDLDDPLGYDHGTNVAAIVAGVAPKANLAVFDVQRSSTLPCTGRITWVEPADIIAAVDWAVANRQSRNVCAINLSVAGGLNRDPCGATPVAVALAEARAVGILPVVSSGNEGSADSLGEPACAPAALSVGMVYDADRDRAFNWTSNRALACNLSPGLGCVDPSPRADMVACPSNSGPSLGMLAPGVLIEAGGNRWGGTSQAAPHVAGAVAVLRSAVPAATAAEVEAALKSSGVSVVDSRPGAGGRTTPRLALPAAIRALNATVAARVAASNGTRPSPSLTVSVNGGALIVGGANVTLRIVAFDAEGGTLRYCAANGNSGGCTPALPLANGATLALPWTLAAGDGQKSVTVVVSATGGGSSSSSTATATATTVVNTQPVRISSFKVNGGAACSSSSTLALTAQATGMGPITFCFSPVAPASPSAPTFPPLCPNQVQAASGAVAAANFTAAMQGYTDSAGLRLRLYAYARDPLGRVASPVPSADVLIDVTAPGGVSASINGGAAWTASLGRVLVSVTSAADVSGLASVCLANGASGDDASRCAPGGGGWVPYSPGGVRWDLAAGGPGPRSVRVWAADGCGNRAAAPAVATTTYATLVANGGSAATASRDVTLTLDVGSGGTPASTMRSASFVEGPTGDRFPSWESPPQMPHRQRLSSRQGSKTLRAKFVDGAGVEASGFTAQIKLDTSAPQMRKSSIKLSALSSKNSGAPAAVSAPTATTATTAATTSPAITWVDGASDPVTGVDRYVLVAGPAGGPTPRAGCGTGNGAVVVATINAAGQSTAVMAVEAAQMAAAGVSGGGGQPRVFRLCAVDGAGNTASGLTIKATVP